MNRVIAFSVFVFLIACNNRKDIKAVELKTQESNDSTLDPSILDNYFGLHEIKPWIVVNNITGSQTEIKVSQHKIAWLNTDDETKIKVDNDLFTLKDKVTLNVVWESKDSVDFANNWDEIRVYKIEDRELMCLRMSFYPCVGLGCSVNYFVVYDFQTKSKSFFGTFRTDSRLALYNFNSDNKIDYLSKTFSGDAHGSTPNEIIYELYSIEGNGHFVKQKNNSGEFYQIKQTIFPSETQKLETFQQRWIAKIK